MLRKGELMKNGKKPTRQQMKIMLSVGINPTHWLVSKNAAGYLTLVHRETGQTKEVLNV